MTEYLPQTVYDACRAKPPKIALYPGEQPAVIKAARLLQDRQLARPILLGGPFSIRDIADEIKISTRGLRIEKPQQLIGFSAIYTALKRTVVFKDAPRHTMEHRFTEPVASIWAALFTGRVEAGLSGSISISRFLTTLLPLWKVSRPGRYIFSYYVLVHPVEKRLLLFADCSFNVRPDAAQLARQAIISGQIYRRISGQPPRVALLSFATMQSAQHARVDIVHRAAEIVKEESNEILCDGPYQVDAALDAVVAQKKAPHGRLKGNANVFIFPTLESGNIAVKMAANPGGWFVIGPMIAGSAEKLHFITGQSGTEHIVHQAVLAAQL